jgi:uncharacterized membrane protein YbhN (UPF0104 family)
MKCDSIYGYTNLVQKIFLAFCVFFFICLVAFFATISLYEGAFEITLSLIYRSLIFFGFSTLILLSFIGWTVASYLDRIFKQGRNRPNYTIDYTIGV